MSDADRFVEGEREVPEWASVLGAQRLTIFRTLVAADLTARGATSELGDGVVEVSFQDGGKSTCGLTNLAQVCGQTPVSDWERLMKSHFDTVFASEAESAALLADVAQLDRVEHLLKLRLYASPVPTAMEGVTWFCAEGLVSVLVFDLPQTIRSVGSRELATWDVDHGELQQRALANTLKEQVERAELAGREDCRISVLSGDSFFVASRILALDRELPLDHPNGALVAVPNRHTLLLHVIEDVSVVHAVNTLVAMATGLYRDGPGSISPSLFWWRGGELTLLPSRLDDKQLTFEPPRTFVDLLDRLATPA